MDEFLAPDTPAKGKFAIDHAKDLGQSTLMKEDILEQLVDDYYQSQGYFTRHNIKFRPKDGTKGYKKQKDSNHSDIDVIGVNPNLEGFDRVVVASCKSWQSGFSIPSKLKDLEESRNLAGREVWKSFRELIVYRWTDASSACRTRHTRLPFS